MDLAAVLSGSGRQPAKRVAELLSGVASALDLIHAKGYVHRDIKPENLMYVVREDGSETVMLLDFGIAALVMSNEPRLTQQGTVFGTPEYLPPEVCKGEQADGRGDVYALATVAFELISGKLPFQFESPLQLIPLKAQLPAASLFQVTGVSYPTALEAVMARGLASAPENRYATASAFVNALEHATSDAPVSWQRGVLRSTSSGRHAIERDEQRSSRQPAARTARFEPPPSLLTDAGGAREIAARLRASVRPAEEVRAPILSEAEEVRRMRGAPSPWRGYGLAIGFAALLLLGGVWLMPKAPVPVSKPLAAASPASAAVEPAAIPTPQPAAPSEPAPAPTAEAEAAPAPDPSGMITPETPGANPRRASAIARSSNSANERLRPLAPLAPVEPADEMSTPKLAAPPEPEVETRIAPVVAAHPAAALPKPVEKGESELRAEPPDAPLHDPALAEQLNREGTSALLRGKVARAVDVLRHATQADPSHAAAWRGLGLALERAGRSPEAMDAYRRYLKLEPNGEQAEMVRDRMHALQE
jgi:serine/threonine-protein kinase